MLKNTSGWLLNMDKGHYNRVILFDLKKAFDTIDHGILKEKLKNTLHKMHSEYRAWLVWLIY